MDNVSPAERSRVMALVKSKDTTPELRVRRLVHGLGYRYRLHATELPGKPDLVLPRLRKVILVHGCFWHQHACPRCRVPSTSRGYWLAKMERNAARDQRNRRALRRLGWDVLVVWECQTTSRRADRLRERLRRFLQR